MGRLDLGVLDYLMSLLVLRCVWSGMWSGWPAHFFLTNKMLGVAVVIDCSFPLYLSGMAQFGRRISRTKTYTENLLHLTPSIKSAIKIIQLRDLNPAGLRLFGLVA